MLDMLKRHQIQVLRDAGHSQEDTARLAGVSERTVRRIDAEPSVLSADTPAERERRRIGRPAKAEQFRDLVRRELDADPSLLSVELVRRARLAGYDGGKTALYELIAELRPSGSRAIVRFEGLPGEFTQHDFGHVDVLFLDGSKRRVHFFASRLKYSRWVQVSLVPNERVESLLRALVEHFDAIGGIPLLAVFDRPKTIALAWNRQGEVSEWNATFGAAMLELGVGVELCWPRRPNQKGSVENLVGWVKGSFFKQRRFLDDADLARQLDEWHEEVNTRRSSRATNVIPAERMAEERARLRPLKVRPADLALRYPVLVGPTGVVTFDGQTYSMSPDAIGVSGTLFLYGDHVRIVAGRFQATHDRVAAGERSVLPEHRTQMVAAVSGKRAKRYLKRQHLLEIGGGALAYLTELTHRRPQQWVRDVDQLHELLQHHGPDAMRGAFDQALSERLVGAEYVAHYLGATAPAQEALPL